MRQELKLDIKRLEDFLGFQIKNNEVSLESNETHDETLSYNLCQNFYGREEELETAIANAYKILTELLREYEISQDTSLIKQIKNFYLLLGNMCYLIGNFKHSAGYFMKCLSYSKNDITPWIGLFFSLRALGEFKLFEESIFNFEEIYKSWKHDQNWELTQEIFLKKVQEANKKLKENSKKSTFLYKDETYNVINVGENCNCNCISCPNEKEGVEGRKSFKEIIGKIKKMDPNLNEVIVTGGEPTIRKDIIEIIRAIRKRFPRKRIVLLTNGRRLSYLSFTKELISYNIIPTITIYGPKKIHDSITRVDGSYNETIKGVKNLIKLNFPFRVIIVFNKINFKSVKDLVRHLIKIDDNRYLIDFIFQATEYIGYSAKRNLKKLHIPLSKMKPSINEVIRIIEGSDYKYSVFFPPCILKNPILKFKTTSSNKEDQRLYYGDKCLSCILNSNCNRIWKTYTDYYGDKEIQTVNNEKLELWIGKNLKDEIRKIYSTHKNYFISLLRFLYGDKKCGRILTTYEEANYLSKLMNLNGKSSVVIPRGLTKSANEFDGIKSQRELNLLLKRLDKNKLLKTINKKENLFSFNKDKILQRIQENIKRNRYNFNKNEVSYYTNNKFYLYFSKEEKILLNILKAEINGIGSPGNIYGYPSCCVKKYDPKSTIDSYFKLCKNIKEGTVNHFLNFLPMNCPLFEHYPCSWSCDKTLEIAKKTLEIIRKFDKNIYKDTLSQLKCSAFITEKNIVVFNKKEHDLNEIELKNFKIWPNNNKVKKIKLKDGFSYLFDDTGDKISKQSGCLLNFV